MNRQDKVQMKSRSRSRDPHVPTAYPVPHVPTCVGFPVPLRSTHELREDMGKIKIVPDSSVLQETRHWTVGM